MSVTKKVPFSILDGVYQEILTPMFNELEGRDFSEIERCHLSINKFVDKHGTIHKFQKVLKSQKMYFPAVKFQIAHRHSIACPKNSFGYIFPIEENIKAFFEVRHTCLIEMIEISKNEIDMNRISTTVNSTIWREKLEYFDGSNVLPIAVYQDDVEVCNPLGSKSGVQKVSAVYICFPLLGEYNYIYLLIYHSNF